MADNKPNREAPGEVRSNIQVVVRVVLVIVLVALLVGLGFALVRLLSRPAAVDGTVSRAADVMTVHPYPLYHLGAAQADG